MGFVFNIRWRLRHKAPSDLHMGRRGVVIATAGASGPVHGTPLCRHDYQLRPLLRCGHWLYGGNQHFFGHGIDPERGDV